MYALSGLTPATRAAAETALPKCYSLEFDRDCIKNANPDGYRGCPQLLTAYDEDFDETEAMVDSLPYCSEQAGRRDRIMYGVMGVLAGLLAGVIIS
ncbi:MAG: hypothetical protein JRD89_07050 [Deltaproteobacteria bacterium]|nr:hypothetical protein [Deltaproteobacteria bacterium]